jgi:hypothetical protein
MIRHRRHLGHHWEAAAHRRFRVGLTLLALLAQGLAPALTGMPSAGIRSVADLDRPVLCLADSANRAGDEAPPDGGRHDAHAVCPACPLLHQLAAYIPPGDAALVVPALGATRIVWAVGAGTAAGGPPIPGKARGPPLPA